MGLFNRLGKLVSSNVNAAVDKVEDPRKLMEQALQDMEQNLRDVSRQRVEIATTLKQSEKQLQHLHARSAELETHAMTALKTGREDLARKALEEKGVVDATLAETQAAADQQRAMVEELGRSVAELQAHIGETRKKRDHLAARLSVAEMKQRQAEARAPSAPGKDHVNDTSAFDTFDRLSERVEHEEASGEALQELSGAPAADALAALDKAAAQDSAADALAALKKKMGR